MVRITKWWERLGCSHDLTSKYFVWFNINKINHGWDHDGMPTWQSSSSDWLDSRTLRERKPDDSVCAALVVFLFWGKQRDQSFVESTDFFSKTSYKGYHQGSECVFLFSYSLFICMLLHLLKLSFPGRELCVSIHLTSKRLVHRSHPRIRSLLYLTRHHLDNWLRLLSVYRLVQAVNLVQCTCHGELLWVDKLSGCGSHCAWQMGFLPWHRIEHVH